jgi:hypothetical protein
MDSMDPVRADRKVEQVEVLVNRKPVELPGKEVTGAEIKQAAIAQGDTTVRPDARLFRKEGERWIFVPDKETIRPHEGEKFRAQGKQEDS